MRPARSAVLLPPRLRLLRAGCCRRGAPSDSRRACLPAGSAAAATWLGTRGNATRCAAPRRGAATLRLRRRPPRGPDRGHADDAPGRPHACRGRPSQDRATAPARPADVRRPPAGPHQLKECARRPTGLDRCAEGAHRLQHGLVGFVGDNLSVREGLEDPHQSADPSPDDPRCVSNAGASRDRAAPARQRPGAAHGPRQHRRAAPPSLARARVQQRPRGARALRRHRRTSLGLAVARQLTQKSLAEAVARKGERGAAGAARDRPMKVEASAADKGVTRRHVRILQASPLLSSSARARNTF